MDHRLEPINNWLDRMVFALVAGLVAIIATLVAQSFYLTDFGKLGRCHISHRPAIAGEFVRATYADGSVAYSER